MTTIGNYSKILNPRTNTRKTTIGNYSKTLNPRTNTQKTTNYPPKTPVLIQYETEEEADTSKSKKFKDILDEFIQLRNTKCHDTQSDRSTKPVSDFTLDDIMCDFSTAFVPIPVAQQLETNGSLVNGRPILGNGVNGIVVDSGTFKGNPLVTKVPIRITEDYIYEIIANMIIINNILLSGKALNHLVPTYGIFQCPKKIIFDGEKPTAIEICSVDGGNDYFLVQKRINGSTLRSKLPFLTEVELKTMVSKILSTLIILEESEYRLNHNDLHTDNIMIDEYGNPYIIDMGLASYIYKGQFVMQSLPAKDFLYLNPTTVFDFTLAFPEILGGLFDINYLFRDIIDHYPTKNPFINILETTVNGIFSLFATDYDETTYTFTYGLTLEYVESIGANKNLLFDVLIKTSLKNKNSNVHDHNLRVLHSYTVRTMINTFLTKDFIVDFLGVYTIIPNSYINSGAFGWIELVELNGVVYAVKFSSDHQIAINEYNIIRKFDKYPHIIQAYSFYPKIV